MYEASAHTREDNITIKYVESASTTFKARFYNHKSSFSNIEKKNQTSLSTYFWKKKEADLAGKDTVVETVMKNLVVKDRKRKAMEDEEHEHLIATSKKKNCWDGTAAAMTVVDEKESEKEGKFKIKKLINNYFQTSSSDMTSGGGGVLVRFYYLGLFYVFF